MVGGKALMAGYAADESAKAPKKWATGDLGYFDEDGFLYITGRKDDVLTTAHGRNISPEWVEKELVATGAVRQAFVLENGSGRLVALVVPEDGWVEKAASKLGVAKNGRDMARDPAIEKAMADEVKRASRALPDYAAVKKVAITTEPFSTSNGLLTQNGRLRRQEIAKKHAELLDRLCAHG
jgi:long-chain acyl-CoA synthetase